MIGKSIQDYIQIRAAILGFRVVAPISLIYLAASVAQGKLFGSTWLALCAMVEAAFYLVVYVPRQRRMQKAAVHPPVLDYEERHALFHKCKCYLVEHYPSGWFLTPDMKKDNIIHWTLWALFFAETMQPEWEEEINGYVAEIEDILGRKLEAGYSEEAKSLRLTFDPVVALHRPIVWYIIVCGVDIYSSLALFRCGFEHFDTPRWFKTFPPRPQALFSHTSSDSDLSYWYRHPHRSTSKHPIVFIHGIGIGFWPYIPFLSDLVKQDPDVGILILEFMPISMHMTNPLLSRVETMSSITRILDSLNIYQFVIVSHSYGTVVSTHILHDSHLSTRVAATLFIDPIPFLLHLPSIAFNFVYRKPRTANEWELWYFASRDADISRAMSRHFFWTENILWKEELENKQIGVVLSGDDQIVDAEEVRKYLTGEERMTKRWATDDLEVLFYPGLDHAMVFDTEDRRKPVLDIIHRFVRLSE